MFLNAYTVYTGSREKNDSRLICVFVCSSIREVSKLKNHDDNIARSILFVSDRFGITDLKLCIESILIEKCLVPSNAS